MGGRVDPYIAPEPRRVHYRRVPRLRVVYTKLPKNEDAVKSSRVFSVFVSAQPPVVCGKLGPLSADSYRVPTVPPRQEPGLARLRWSWRHGERPDLLRKLLVLPQQVREVAGYGDLSGEGQGSVVSPRLPPPMMQYVLAVAQQMQSLQEIALMTNR